MFFTSIAVAALALTSAFAAAPEGCKFVNVSRPGVNAQLPDINLTFRGVGGDVAAIKACNPDKLTAAGESNVIGVATSPTAGARVSIRTKNGAGVVGLPTILANGSVHQNACTLDKDAESGFKAAYYYLEWSDGLPGALNLADESAKQDAAFLRTECERTMPPNVKAQLTKK